MYQITGETLELWSANKLSTALPWIPDCSSVQIERFLGILAVYKQLNQGVFSNFWPYEQSVQLFRSLQLCNFTPQASRSSSLKSTAKWQTKRAVKFGLLQYTM